MYWYDIERRTEDAAWMQRSERRETQSTGEYAFTWRLIREEAGADDGLGNGRCSSGSPNIEPARVASRNMSSSKEHHILFFLWR
jgi:hypothetical protein